MKETLTHNALEGLNNKQLQAVISKEKRLLVLAGAGSGKTRTLLEKVNYLISEEQVESKSILAITFTKNAANEMIDRMILSVDQSGYYQKVLNGNGFTNAEIHLERSRLLEKYSWLNQLTFKTFHSFCYQILRNEGANVFDNKFKIVPQQKDNSSEFNSISAEKTEPELLRDAAVKLCHDKDYLLLLKRYILDYYVDCINEDDEGKERRGNGEWFRTLKGDHVRSKSEQYIADWLYRHSIEYVYEKKERIGKKSFYPDFFIPSANLYLEHVSDLSYPTYWKEMEFKQGGKKCIKTYDKVTRSSVAFNQMLDKVVKGKISKSLEATKVLNYDEEFSGYHKELNRFYRQVKEVKGMLGTSNKSLNEIRIEAAKNKHERVRLFYELAIPIIEEYYNNCTDKSYIDFDGLIEYAIRLFKENEKVRSRYLKRFKYVLVDEFQDVNNSQVEFLKLLLAKDSQLFCVGDDWQSIYGFRGSEIDYIVNFEKHFENAKLITLNFNYRSSDTIVVASNEIIKNNNFQIPKEIKAVNRGGKKIEVHYEEFEGQEVSFAWEKIQYHLSSGIKPEEILILYRRSAMSEQLKKALKKSDISVQFKTIHGAKGLEAKVVFILGLHASRGGFPDPWLQDKIYHIIKKTDYEVLYEEERRLFYVALTRAKEYVYLMSKKGSVSDFVKEIPKNLLENHEGNLKPIGPIVVLCKSCNSLLNDHYKFCPECGHKIKDTKTVHNGQKIHSIDLEVKKQTDQEIIVTCLKNLTFLPGLTYLAKILKGSKSVLTQGNSPEDFMHYGAFPFKTIKTIKTQIQELVDADILGTSIGSFGRVKICVPRDPEVKVVEHGQITLKGNWIKEEAQKKYANAYESWTEKHDEELEKMFCEGKTKNEMMSYFQRSYSAIRARIERLELIDKYS